jgi:hypothetical protein
VLWSEGNISREMVPIYRIHHEFWVAGATSRGQSHLATCHPLLTAWGAFFFYCRPVRSVGSEPTVQIPLLSKRTMFSPFM